MNRVIRAFTYNWPLKVLAVLLATLLYAGLVVSQSTFELPSPIAIRPLNQPSGAFLLTTLPSVSRVRYVSSGDVGAPATPASFEATIDLSGVNPQANSTYVAIEVKSIDPRFLAVDWEPRGINVQLDPLSSYKVPVRVMTGTPPANLDVRKPQLSAATVTVTGPDSVVRLVVEVQADVLIDPAGLTVDRDVPLIPVDQAGNRVTPVQVDPQSVHVTIPVFSNSTTKALAVNPVVIGTPPTGYVVDTITVTPSTMSVEGNADQLATLARADTEPISIGTATGTIDTDVDLALPAGVLPIGPASVHVVITLRAETGTKTFAVGLIPVGQQAGLTYQYSTLTAFVIVAGPLADLNRLDPTSFTVPIDVTGLGVGVHEVTPIPNLQAGLRLLSVEPAKVTVTISLPPSAAPSPSTPGG
jgi:YbbR domain-containing protein